MTSLRKWLINLQILLNWQEFFFQNNIPYLLGLKINLNGLLNKIGLGYRLFWKPHYQNYQHSKQNFIQYYCLKSQYEMSWKYASVCVCECLYIYICRYVCVYIYIYISIIMFNFFLVVVMIFFFFFGKYIRFKFMYMSIHNNYYF